jgi:hypothetical protein
MGPGKRVYRGRDRGRVHLWDLVTLLTLIEISRSRLARLIEKFHLEDGEE